MNAVAHRLMLAAFVVCCMCGAAMAEIPIDSLLREADAIRTSDPARFQRLLSDLDRAAERASPEQKQQLEFLHAYQLVRVGDLTGAIARFKVLKETASSVDLRYRAGAMLANAYAITRQFREGLVVAEQTLQLSGDVADRDSRHHGFLAAGVLYNQVGDYELGRQYADRVLAESTNPRNQCIAGNLRIESTLHLGESLGDGEAINALRQCEALKDATLAGFSRIYLARKWYREGRTQEAVKLIESRLSEVEATGYPRLVAEVHALLAEMRLSLNDVSIAELHAKTAIAHNIDIVNSLALVDAYKVLVDIAERKGDAAAALSFYKQYAAAERGYHQDVAAREMAYQIVRHQSLQQTQQIALLNQQNDLLQLQQRVQQQEAQNARLVMVMLVLLLATLGLWTYKTKRMQLSLRRMAETDALTGICNRHHFNLRAAQLLGQCERRGEDVVLVMFDLDHFKSINDRYGHASGDWVLRQVAEVCVPLCREVDVFGRLGGEEFAVLLAGHDLRSARRMADDLRVRLAGIDTSGSGDVFRVTASFGVATSQLTGHDLDRLMSTADRMLYRAKRAGRNRVCVYEGRVSPTHAIPVRAVEDSLLTAEGAPPATESDTGQGTWVSVDKSRNVATS